ncbi:MAG: toll/interleukin-1 receptor domain-containing protein, partial [Candidatus Hodarchaeota archaeon]
KSKIEKTAKKEKKDFQTVLFQKYREKIDNIISDCEALNFLINKKLNPIKFIDIYRNLILGVNFEDVFWSNLYYSKDRKQKARKGGSKYISKKMHILEEFVNSRYFNESIIPIFEENFEDYQKNVYPPAEEKIKRIVRYSPSALDSFIFQLDLFYKPLLEFRKNNTKVGKNNVYYQALEEGGKVTTFMYKVFVHDFINDFKSPIKVPYAVMNKSMKKFGKKSDYYDTNSDHPFVVFEKLMFPDERKPGLPEIIIKDGKQVGLNHFTTVIPIAIPGLEEFTRDKYKEEKDTDELIIRIKWETPGNIQEEKKPMIFLSHSSKDKDFARKLEKELSANNIQVWIDEKDIRGGQPIPSKVLEGLAKTDLFIIIISKNSNTSKWVNFELQYMFNRQMKENRTIILPVYLEDCKLPPLIEIFKYFDFRDEKGYKSHLEELINNINYYWKGIG